MKKRFRSGVNIHRTRSFPGADIGSDHDLVMMTFQVRLKKARKPNQPRLRFDLEKLRNPDVACTFQATIGGVTGRFSPPIPVRTPGCFGPIPFQSGRFGLGRFGPILEVGRFGQILVGRFGPLYFI